MINPVPIEAPDPALLGIVMRTVLKKICSLKLF
jgi:hypothetical protein